LSLHAGLGLAALKKYYSTIIDNLPPNHLSTLIRLLDVAIVPEEIVDSIVPSPSAEIGNKMIVNYLIGLIHNEEHIITFCHIIKRMIRDFDKCVCVLNMQNSKKFRVCNKLIMIFLFSGINDLSYQNY